MAVDALTNVESPSPRIGSYTLVQSLGSGGMSSVYRGVHADNGLEVAVKILPRSLAKNTTLLQRFLREAKSAEALEHPNIVAIYDRGIDQGRHYIVLEYVAGGDLHDWVRTHGPMPIADAIKAVHEVGAALDFAASRGLIHRDIKPANLLRTIDGRIKVADLGLALKAEAEDERVTREGTTVGTVDYMSPEQARDSRATSIRSDIYSLGCTFFFLLTGQPPFAGGDVADKLSRHCLAPPPDPRELREDIPPGLSTIVRKMMAKKPEQRYPDYDSLLADLDRVANEPAAEVSETAEGGIPLLSALVAEDEAESSDGFIPLTLAGPEPARPRADEPRLADVSLAELAAIDDEGPPAPAIARPERPPHPAPRAAAPLDLFPEDDVGLGDTSGEFVDEEGMPAAVALGGSRPMTAEERSWILTCVLVGLAFIGLVIGVDQLIRNSGGSVSETTEAVAEAPRVEPLPIPPPEPATPVKAVAGEAAKAKSNTQSQPSPSPTPRPPQPMIWVEPVDTLPVLVPEPRYGAAVEARSVPSWAVSEAPSRLLGKTLIVRRIPDPADPDQKPTLRAALDINTDGAIEVADDGPFFENDLRVVGDARMIRARPGYRTIVSCERPRLEILQRQPAVVGLGARSLILDGLDLIIDATTLPRNQTALFLCQGGALTFRNCTITVVNRGEGSFSIVEAGASAEPSRIRFEKTLLRGNFSSAVNLTGGPAEVVFHRSVVFTGQGSALTVTPSAADRKVAVIRSIFATPGSALAFSAVPARTRPRPLLVRTFGSTLARIFTNRNVSLISSSVESATATDLVDWRGDYNTVTGWSDWLSVGSAHTVRVGNIASARAVWRATDTASDEAKHAWPAPIAADRVIPEHFKPHAPNRLDILSRVASPSGFLHEKTIETFPRNALPELATEALPGMPAPAVERPAGEDPARVRDVKFDANQPPWMGDLGRFLNDEIKASDGLVRVSVTGSGEHPWSPTRLPNGVSLEIRVVGGAGAPTPSWTSAPDASGEALISVHQGNLVLDGLRITRDGSARLERLVRVERGHLVLNRCWLRSQGDAEPGGGGLIGFSASGTEPLKPFQVAHAPWPFTTSTDRPTCRITDSLLLTSGDVLSAELGRGFVALNQCAVVAGRSAFNLTPGLVSRKRFEAELWLDRCTVASEHDMVRLGRWRGFEPGPDRPWLISSQNSAYFDMYDRPERLTAMLQVDLEAFTHGAIFWQSHGDAYEVSQFARNGEAKAAGHSHPDVHFEWAELWGENHIKNATGPRAPASHSTVRLIERLKPGHIDPGDLFLDPAHQAARRISDLGVDLARLGITPSVRANRRR